MVAVPLLLYNQARAIFSIFSIFCEVEPVSEFIDNSLETQVENIQIADVSAKRIQVKAKCIFKSAVPSVWQEVVLL